MDELNKAQQRFNTQDEDLKLVFVPQCSTCINNINFYSCKVFPDKPLKYVDMETYEICKSYRKG